MYRSAKSKLRSAINKARGWENLVNEMNEDLWGDDYKYVTRKIRACGALHTKYRPDPVQVAVNSAESVEGCLLFAMIGLKEAVLTMKNKKAPSLDGIPAEVYKVVFHQRPELLLGSFNTCLKEGIFPCRWKVTRLALFSKGKGDSELVSAYRPLYMLDTAGKVLEKLIRGRFPEAMRAAEDLSPRQFEFRTGRTTVDTIMEVVAAVH